MREWLESSMWPLSNYALPLGDASGVSRPLFGELGAFARSLNSPVINMLLLLGFYDISPEEVRLEAYEAQSTPEAFREYVSVREVKSDFFFKYSIVFCFEPATNKKMPRSIKNKMLLSLRQETKLRAEFEKSNGRKSELLNRCGGHRIDAEVIAEIRQGQRLAAQPATML